MQSLPLSMYKSLQGTFDAFVIHFNYCELTFCFLSLQKKCMQAIGIEHAERVHAEETVGIVGGGGDAPLSALAATENAQEFSRFLNQAAQSAFTQVAMQHQMRGVQVQNPDIAYLDDGFMVNTAREMARSDLFENNQALQRQLGNGTGCLKQDGSSFDARQQFRKKKKGSRSCNDRLDLAHADHDTDSSDDEAARYEATIAQSLLLATAEDRRKKPPASSQQEDQTKKRSHFAPGNLRQPLGISGIAKALFGGPAPSFNGTFEPVGDVGDDIVAMTPGAPARISPPVPHIPPPPASAPFVSPSFRNNAAAPLHAPIPVYQDRVYQDRPNLEARVIARSMQTASQRFGELCNVDEPAMGWQPRDDKDAKRAKKRLKHMSENPQMVSMVLSNCTENAPEPDSQEAIVIYDEVTDQWDD